MFRKLLAVFVISGFLVSGCATKGGYTPTIDSYNDPNADRIAQDLVECRQLAEQAAGDTAKETGKGAIVGGLLGAAAGAAIGAATGHAGTGAAVGAAAGGIGGGAKEGFGAEEQFKRSYQKCMRGRGHKVID